MAWPVLLGRAIFWPPQAPHSHTNRGGTLRAIRPLTTALTWQAWSLTHPCLAPAVAVTVPHGWGVPEGVGCVAGDANILLKLMQRVPAGATMASDWWNGELGQVIAHVTGLPESSVQAVEGALG